MDFVYLCKSGENEELRYSIRSVISSFPNAKIWLVGGKPDWYIGDYIQVAQDKTIYTNVVNNLKAVCESKEINNKFILMNDDFFIVNKIKKINYLNGGLLSDKILFYKEVTKDSSYITRLSDTHNRLKKYNIQDPLNYELHVPFPIEKDKLKKIMERDFRFLWRSVYGNKFSVGGKTIKDVKVYDGGGLMKKSFDYENNKTDFLSSTDTSFIKIKPMLEELFPDKTKYETI